MRPRQRSTPIATHTKRLASELRSASFHLLCFSLSLTQLCEGMVRIPFDLANSI